MTCSQSYTVAISNAEILKKKYHLWCRWLSWHIVRIHCRKNMIHCNYEVRDKDIASVASKQQQVYVLNWADQGATECGALNVININNNMGLEKARDKEKRYGDDKTTFKTKSVLLIVYHLCVKHVSNRTYKLKCLHGHVVMSFTNFQNVHTIITTDSMNVSGRTVHYIFFGLVCVRASVYEYMSTQASKWHKQCDSYVM